jgi:hypothetical protein
LLLNDKIIFINSGILLKQNSKCSSIVSVKKEDKIDEFCLSNFKKYIEEKFEVKIYLNQYMILWIFDKDFYKIWEYKKN